LNFRQFGNQRKNAKRESVSLRIAENRKSRQRDEEEERDLERNAMTTDTHRQSAKIYDFPSGGRPKRTSTKTLPQMTAPALTEVEFGRCWYHDAAVDEEHAEMLAKPARIIRDRS
jgi:uncharacterized protein DUF2735